MLIINAWLPCWIARRLSAALGKLWLAVSSIIAVMNVEEPLDRYVCRLCHFSADNQKAFHEHLVEKHRGAGDESRVLIEYRKKVIGLLEHMGPDVSWLKVRNCLSCCDRVPRVLKNVYWKQNCLSNAS